MVRPAAGAELQRYDPLTVVPPFKQPAERDRAREDSTPVDDFVNLLRHPRLTPPEVVAVCCGYRLKDEDGLHRRPQVSSEDERKIRGEVERRVCSFVERWGLLGLNAAMPANAAERLEAYLDAALRFTLLWEAARAYVDHPTADLGVKIANGFHGNEVADLIPWAADVEHVDGIDFVLSESGAVSIRVPFIKESRTFILGWQYRSLWHALHLQLGLTLWRGDQYLRRCARSRCQRAFTTTVSRQVYCSHACQKAERQLRWLHKQKNGNQEAGSDGQGEAPRAR